MLEKDVLRNLQKEYNCNTREIGLPPAQKLIRTCILCKIFQKRRRHGRILNNKI